MPDEPVSSAADPDLDRDVRHQVYIRFRDAGYPPTPAELTATLERSEEEIRAALERLAEDRALVFDASRRRIVTAPPFSAIPTPFWVETPRGSWWAPCAWEALGIAALLECDARIHTTAGATSERLEIVVNRGTPHPEHLLIHLPVPARRWWHDVRYTCSTILFFASEGEIDAWCAARGFPRGAVLSVQQMWHLAGLWFGGRFDLDWRRLTPEEARQSFSEAGLDGDFWDLG